MERSVIKKTGLLPGLVVSALLMGATIDSSRVEAASLPMQGTQVAWWGFYPSVGLGFYGPGYYRPAYYGYGYRYYGYRPAYYGYYRPACERSCWRNYRGYVRCKVRCF